MVYCTFNLVEVLHIHMNTHFLCIEGTEASGWGHIDVHCFFMELLLKKAFRSLLWWQNVIKMVYSTFIPLEVLHSHMNNHFLCIEGTEASGWGNIDVHCDLMELLIKLAFRIGCNRARKYLLFVTITNFKFQISSAFANFNVLITRFGR